MEEHANGPESGGVTPPDGDNLAERLRRLEEEAERLRAALSGTPEPVANDAPAPDAPVAEPEPEPAPKVEDPVKAEGLLRQARLARSRGQNDVAGRLLQEAIEAAPNSSIVLEAVGDDLMEAGKLGKARDAYEKAFRLDAKNVSAERKFGILLVQTDPIATMALFDEANSPARTKVAVILSALLPGLGQMVTNEIPKGISLMVITVTSWVWIVLTPRGIEGLVGLITGRTGSGPQAVPFNGMIIVPIIVGAITWIVAVADLAGRTKTRAPILIDRPKPPVDLPYE